MNNNEIMSLMEKYAWDKLYISTGNAHIIPERLCGLISAASEADAKRWYMTLENFIVVQGGVYEAALPSIDVLITALKCFQVSGIATVYIYDLIHQVVNGVTDIDAIRRGNEHEADKCRELVRRNLDLLGSRSIHDTTELLDLITQNL